MRVLSAPKQMHGLSAFGLEVVEYVRIDACAGEADTWTTSARLQGDLLARDLRFAIVAARFNERSSRTWCAARWTRCCGTAPARSRSRWCACPAPSTCRSSPGARRGRRYDAIVALGAVIRGATPHFDYVADQCAARPRARGRRHRRAGRVRRADDGHDRAGRSSAPAPRPATRAPMRRCAALELANLLRRLDDLMMPRRRSDRAGRARSLSRRLAMQALYQWQMTGQTSPSCATSSRPRRITPTSTRIFRRAAAGRAGADRRARCSARRTDRPAASRSSIRSSTPC